MLDLNADYHLSPDRTRLLDRNDEVVALARDTDGKTVYIPAEALTKGKVCIKVKIEKLQVCIEYDGNQICIGWDTIEVETCLEWGDE